MFRTFLQELKLVARGLRKNPGFATVAVLTLALGIGANAAIFSVVDALVLNPLPLPSLNRVVKVWESAPSRGVDHNEIAVANFADWVAQSNSFEHLGAYAHWGVNVSGLEVPERVQGFLVTSGFFSALGVQPQIGRLFLPDEHKTGEDYEIILSYGYWQSHFASDPQILGKSLTLNGTSRAVVGVMPANFNFPPGAQMWAPYPLVTNTPGARRSHFLYSVGLLKPGVSLAQAQVELNGIAARLEQRYPQTNKGWRVAIVPLVADVSRDYRLALVVLLSAVGFLLLIACANIANLMLVRTAARRREFAIRAALGAGKLRVVRQLLTESILLSILGGGAGILLAIWGVNLLPRLFPANVMDRVAGAGHIAVDYRALAFTFTLAILTGIVFGLAPGFTASRLDVNGVLKENAIAAGSAGGQHRLHNSFVVAQISLALVLLIGTGLMVKSFVRLLEVNPGFRTDHILTMELMLPGVKYKQDQQTVAFYQQLIERVRAVPGVDSAGAVSLLPLAGSNETWGIFIEGRPAPPPGEINEVNYRVIVPGYFQTLGISLVEGRGISDDDVAAAPRVILLNQAAVDRFFPGQDPVGAHVRFHDVPSADLWITVVGVVANVHNELSGNPKPEIYVPEAQAAEREMVLTIRTAAPPLSVASAVRSQIAALDKDQPVSHIATFDEVRSESVFTSRVSALLLGIFAALALLLAGIGVYGVISYAVGQRMREIGIRVALGAQRSNVLTLVVSQGLRLVGLGITIGLIGAVALTRLMTSLLFNVQATDPATFLGITALLVAVSLLACFVPARRAMQVDPITALRHD
jgi:putative ABC transport system permease protein